VVTGKERTAPRAAVAASVLLLGGFVGCGGGGGDDQTRKTARLSIVISDAGGVAKYAVPASSQGGRVQLRLANRGRTGHPVQLLRLDGDHTAAEAFAVLRGNPDRIPDWLRAEGGLGPLGPGHTVDVALDLPAGRYVVTDLPRRGSPRDPPHTEFRLTGGPGGRLTPTSTTIEAAALGPGRYAWKVSGAGLRSGRNRVTFRSQGAQALHLIATFRLRDAHASRAQILRALRASLPTARIAESYFATATLDGGQAQTTILPMGRPGRYVLFCPLSDRAGRRPHFEEGLLTTIEVR
jgi:hypothetical protein